MNPSQNDHELFLSLVEYTEDLIWAIDRNYNLVFCNRVFRNEVEYSPGQCIEIGQSVLENPAYASVRDEWKNNYDKVFVTGLPFRIEIKTVFLPSEKTIEFGFNPVKNQDGIVTAVMVIGRDVTARKESVRALSDDITEHKQIQ